MSIFGAIEQARVRDDVVDEYVTAIVVDCLTEDTDWAAVNRAIVAKWSVAGLAYIKERAWKRIEARP